MHTLFPPQGFLSYYAKPYHFYPGKQIVVDGQTFHVGGILDVISIR